MTDPKLLGSSDPPTTPLPRSWAKGTADLAGAVVLLDSTAEETLPPRQMLRRESF